MARMHAKKTEPKTASLAAKVATLARLFWDRPLGVKELERYPVWVVARVLDHGTLEDIALLVELWGRRRFLEEAARARFASPKTESLWRRILEREGVACTRKSFPRMVWNS
jgi:hypothetical protein